MERVPSPPDDALVFDVEVLMSAGQRPTLACAVSPDSWLVGNDHPFYSILQLAETESSVHIFLDLLLIINNYNCMNFKRCLL